MRPSHLLILIVPIISVVPRVSPAQETVKIIGQDNFTLNANYYDPGTTGNAVLFLHQCNRKGEKTGFETIAEKLKKQGVHSLILDFRGFGMSRNDEYQDFHQQMDKTEQHFPGDVEQTFQFLLAQENINKKNIQIISASCGVSQGIILTSRYENIRSIVMLSGSFDDPEKMATKIRKLTVPIFIVYSEEDKYDTPKSMVSAFAASNHPKSKMISIKGNLHGTQMFDQDANLEDTIIQWLSNQN